MISDLSFSVSAEVSLAKSTVPAFGKTRHVLGALAMAGMLFGSCMVFGQATHAANNEIRGDRRRVVPGVLPTLAFEPNAGQVDAAATRYVARGAGFEVQLRANEAELRFAAGAVSKGGKNQQERWPITMRLVGGNKNAMMEASEKLPGTKSYFPTSDVRTWHVNVPTFGRVTYGSVYPGVDLTFYGRESRLEYDFSLGAGVDAGAILMRLDGVEKASVDAKGDLRLGSAEHTATFLKPVAYQVLADGKTRQPVAVGYELKTAESSGTVLVGFRVGRYDPARPLVIDPVLSYGEYPAQFDEAYPVAVQTDAANNVYVVSNREVQPYAVIVKVDPDGTVLKTFSVGTTATAGGIAVDSGGNIYVTGGTGSGFPVTANAYRGDSAGGQDAFFCVLKADGSGLLYSTLYGGSGDESGQAIAVDAAGKAYITGTSTSTDLPTTNGVFQTTTGLPSGGYSGYVAKFDPMKSGSASLVYSTYLNGGSGNSFLNAIGVDPQGNALVTGMIDPSFPVTTGAVHYAQFGSVTNQPMVYAIKVNPDASGLVYSAQLGPGTGNAVAVDRAGAAYVAGLSAADDFPTTPGAYQVQSPGIFATKVAVDGKSLAYSTFLGGPSGANITGGGKATAIALPPGCAADCVATVAGSTDTDDFPQIDSIDAIPVGDGSPNAFVVQLTPMGNAATFSTYVSGVEAALKVGPSLAVDSAGGIVIALESDVITDLPTTVPVPPTDVTVYVGRISPAEESRLLVSPVSYDFGQVIRGQQLTVHVTLRNVGSKPAKSISFFINGDGEFAETDDCGNMLAGGARCTLHITFTPATAGLRTGNLTIMSDSSSSPVTMALTGQGIDSAHIGFSQSIFAFGDQALNTTSAPQTFTITNTGGLPATLGAAFTIAATPTAAFTVVSDCPAILVGGASCTAQMTFTPLQAGLNSGSLTSYLGTSGYLGTDPIVVTGTGIAGGDSGSLIPESSIVNYGTVPVGTTVLLNDDLNKSSYFFLLNNGSVPVTISNLSFASAGGTDYTNDFRIDNTVCTFFYTAQQQTPLVLPPQGSCHIEVLFTPSVAKLETVTLMAENSTATNPVTVTLMGLGTTATQSIDFMPSNANFGDQAVGTSSNQQNIFVSNRGNTGFTISRVTATGDFAILNDACVGLLIPSINGYNGCSIPITFRPSAPGLRTGIVTIYDSFGKPQMLSLSGVGIAPTGTLRVENSALSFAPQAKGTTSASQSVFLVNTGNTPVQTNTIGITGDFSVSYTSCSAEEPIAPGSSCEVKVAFTPMQTSGTENGVLTITTAAGNFSATLQGGAEAATEGIAFTPLAVDFKDVQASMNSVSGRGNNPAVFLRNTGTASVTFNAAPTVSANFAIQQNYCGGAGFVLAPQATCEVDVQFNAPAGPGVVNGTLTIADTAGTQTVPLTGNSVAAAPAVSFEPAVFAFNQQAKGSVSPLSSPIYLFNSTSTALAITSITTSADFLIPQQGDCVSAGVPAHSYCGIFIEFAPAATGFRTGTLTVKDSTNKTYTLPLSGFAPSELNSAMLSQENVVFADQVAAAASANIAADALQNIYLMNSGNVALTVGPVTGAASGDFLLQASPTYDQCSNRVVAPGHQCQVSLQFTPTSVGAKTGSLSFPVTYADNTTATLSLPLSGKGVAANEHVTLTPTALSFIDQTAGLAYPTPGADSPETLQLTNDGNVLLTVGHLTRNNTTDFALYGFAPDGCSGVVLRPGASCAVSVEFQPTAAGAKSGTVTFPFHYSDSANTAGTATATLSGKGLAPDNTLVLTPATTDFPVEIVNTTDTGSSFSVTNNGNNPVVLGTASVTANFTLSNTCNGRTIYPADSCYYSVQFTPTSSSSNYIATPYTGTFTVPVVGGRTLTSSLSGMGIPASAQVVLSQQVIDFGNIDVSKSSTYIDAEIVNRGSSTSGSVNVASVTLGGTNASDFSLAAGCVGALAGRTTCLFYAKFSPAASSTGVRTATITITYGNGQTLVLALKGTGTTPLPQATVFPAVVDFGSAPIGSATGVRNFEIANSGTSNLTLRSLVISNSTVFPVRSDRCSGATLTPGQQCVVSLAFLPSVAGQIGAEVTVPSNAGMQIVTLSGTGTIIVSACQTVDYSNGFTADGLSLNNGARIVGQALQLTDGKREESRSAFTTALVPVDKFSTDFTFQILNPEADGITFTVQSKFPEIVGKSGGGLGYAGIGRSVAFKFDLFDNDGEGANSIGQYLFGQAPATPAVPLGLDLHSGHVFKAHIGYVDGVTLMRVTDMVTGASQTQAFVGYIEQIAGLQAYVGFTAGTGGLTSTVKILSWTFQGGSTCIFQPGVE